MLRVQLRFLAGLTLFVVISGGLALVVAYLYSPTCISRLLMPGLVVLIILGALGSGTAMFFRESRGRIRAERDAHTYKRSLVEKAAGFPSLLDAIQYYETIRDEEVSKYLETKKHPARRSAELIRDEARRRREAEYESKRNLAIIEYYESIAPFLLDFKDDVLDENDTVRYRDYDEEERQDAATGFLTKEEFRRLSTGERNQLALDRFWARAKSKWLVGRIYERYVGYLYEEEGYDVEYVGIIKGYEDLGRDLICRKGDEFIIVQCKNWSQFRTIYEKHIFQFFGTVFQYRHANPDQAVDAVFCTATAVSDIARIFASELGIGLWENFKMDPSYPSVKCNVSRVDGTRIYHLPFDQQYDHVKVEKQRGEFYCETVKEAEDRGFRRAYRFRGRDQIQTA